MTNFVRTLLFGASLTVLGSTQAFGQAAAPAAPSPAPQADESVGIQDIVVTAQKRSETANRVGMSITAISSDTLTKANVVAVSELAKVVPGFTFTEAPRGAPVFAIRGIGFQDSTVGSASTVALYLDEVPISFPMEARFPALDLERVEVIKGPQGILFGQNSTGGAINFIAAKPTEDLHAGMDLSYGRFNLIQGSAFISGRVAENVKMRLSVTGVHSGGWQSNRWLNGRQGVVYQNLADSTSPLVPITLGRDYQNSLGAKRGFAGRLITEWDPTDALKVTLNVNGWFDKSDSQAAQLLYAHPLLATVPYVPYDLYPTPPRNARDADWDPYPNNYRLPGSFGRAEPLRHDDTFFQASLRLDYSLSDQLRLTSISALSRYKQNFALETDGTALSDFQIGNTARARSFTQEVRLTGDYDNIKFIIGGNYERHNVDQEDRYYFDLSSVNLGLFNAVDSHGFFREPIRTIAAFGNMDFKPTDIITLHAGVRYTKDKRSYTGCTADTGSGSIGNAFNILIPLINPPGAPFTPIQPGGCYTSNQLSDPALVTVSNPQGLYNAPGLAHFKLNEDNVSWRLGVDLQATPTTLLYANVSKGYKSGGFPAVNVASNVQLEGVKQESILAFEAGVKASLFDRRVQINLAGFYNDYRNKQLRGRILDPFGYFGVLDKLLNIPKSRVYGADFQVQVAPTQGLNLNFGGTYTNTRVTGHTDGFYDPAGNQIDYKGLRFPNTPLWSITAGADYETPITASLSAFAGVSMLYQSSTIGLFARPEQISQVDLDAVVKPGVKIPGDAFDIKAYTTVDAQLGVKASDHSWRAWIWGKNIFNTYYWTNATQSLDSIYRLTAMPATYGVSVSFKF